MEFLFLGNSEKDQQIKSLKADKEPIKSGEGYSFEEILSVSQNEDICMLQLTRSGLFCLLCATSSGDDVNIHLSGKIHNTNLQTKLKVDAFQVYQSF